MKNYFVRLFIAILFLTTANESAEVYVVGEPIRIGNIEVAQFDFPRYLKMWEAKRACTLLGGKWRLPTKDELNSLYENKDKFGLLSDSYWSASKETNDSYYIWGQNVETGEQKQLEPDSSVKVRVVRVL